MENRKAGVFYMKKCFAPLLERFLPFFFSSLLAIVESVEINIGQF